MAAEMKLSNEAVQLLNMETCKKGLKTLGLHPVTQRHAFLELSLPSLGIEDIGVLQNFPQIVYLDISHNCISSLRVLENMSSLLQLRARFVHVICSATSSTAGADTGCCSPSCGCGCCCGCRNNKITDCLNFSPPHCKETHSWPEGGKAIGSMLTLVDLSHNHIRRIGDLSHHRFLECLLLAKNQLSWIEGLHNLRFLQVHDSWRSLCRTAVPSPLMTMPCVFYCFLL